MNKGKKNIIFAISLLVVIVFFLSIIVSIDIGNQMIEDQENIVRAQSKKEKLEPYLVNYINLYDEYERPKLEKEYYNKLFSELEKQFIQVKEEFNVTDILFDHGNWSTDCKEYHLECKQLAVNAYRNLSRKIFDLIYYPYINNNSDQAMRVQKQSERMYDKKIKTFVERMNNEPYIDFKDDIAMYNKVMLWRMDDLRSYSTHIYYGKPSAMNETLDPKELREKHKGYYGSVYTTSLYSILYDDIELSLRMYYEQALVENVSLSNISYDKLVHYWEPIVHKRNNSFLSTIPESEYERDDTNNVYIAKYTLNGYGVADKYIYMKPTKLSLLFNAYVRQEYIKERGIFDEQISEQKNKTQTLIDELVLFEQYYNKLQEEANTPEGKLKFNTFRSLGDQSFRNSHTASIMYLNRLAKGGESEYRESFIYNKVRQFNFFAKTLLELDIYQGNKTAFLKDNVSSTQENTI